MQRHTPNSILPVARSLSLSAASDELQVDQSPFHVQAPILPIVSNASLSCDPNREKVLPFNAYLTNYAREATEMAESPLHLLIDVMAAEKNASLHSNEGMPPNFRQVCLAYKKSSTSLRLAAILIYIFCYRRRHKHSLLL